MPEVYNGIVGAIKTGPTATATAIAHMANWNLNMSREAIPVTSFGSEWKENLPGVKEWDADFDGTADFATGSGQEALQTAFDDGTTLTFGFYLNATKYFEGQGIITEFSVSHDAEGKADISISVTGTGGVTMELGA